MNDRRTSPPLKPPPLHTRSRLLALIAGPAYLFLVGCVLGSATHTSLAMALAATVLGAVAIMTVLAVLGAKAYQYRQSTVRFTLSTAFLVSVPLCIYLSAVRWVLQSQPTAELDWSFWIAIACLAIFWMGVTTVVLVCLAEAIVWLAVALRRWLSPA